jgi:predicted kinase
VPRLILLNGPPAAGKSTLARLYADEHPLTLNLDIDRVRGLLGRWQHDLARAGLLARDIAIAAARVHLGGGRDVVVPQLVARVDFIERLETVAGESGARFCEVVLLDDRENLQARYRERGRTEGTAVRRDPAVSTDRTDAELSQAYDELLSVLAARPAAAVIRTRTGSVAQAYQDLLAALARQIP